MRIVFLGDSLTEGVDGASYLRALNERIASDPQLRGATLINAGRGAIPSSTRPVAWRAMSRPIRQTGW